MPRPTWHGEIVWADIDKRRPVVVVSRDDANGVRHRASVAAITTRVRAIPSEVAVDEGDGLSQPCAVNCDELVTIDKVRLHERIGRLSGERLEALHRALAFALAIPLRDGRG